MIPSQLALQTATQIAEKAKKEASNATIFNGVSFTYYATANKPALQWNQPSLQAVSTAFGTAKTINNTPVTPKNTWKDPRKWCKEHWL